MDGATFKKWWNLHLLPKVRAWTHEKVLLLVDGCSSHNELVDPRGQVKVMTYPPNCTSKHHPRDMGIIATTKRLYRSKLLAAIVANLSAAKQLWEEAGVSQDEGGHEGTGGGVQAPPIGCRGDADRCLEGG